MLKITNLKKTFNAGTINEKQALREGVRQYLSQLDKYYQSILSILQF